MVCSVWCVVCGVKLGRVWVEWSVVGRCGSKKKKKKKKRRGRDGRGDSCDC